MVANAEFESVFPSLDVPSDGHTSSAILLQRIISLTSLMLVQPMETAEPFDMKDCFCRLATNRKIRHIARHHACVLASASA